MTIKTTVKNTRSYLSRDFNSLRATLIDYARQYYPDKITDFSEGGVASLFVDMAAMVGDNLSFYLDHQFNELDPATVVENANIQRMLKAVGIKPASSSPAVVNCTFSITVPSDGTKPVKAYVPIIQAGTVLRTSKNVNFTLRDDVKFIDDYTGEVLPGVQKSVALGGAALTLSAAGL